jgi:sec-independent protein translocase protein TatB
VFNLGMGEITVILLLALIFLGPGKLPDLAAGLGKLIKEIRKATSDVKNEIALDDSFRKPFEDLRDAVTLHPDELKRRDQWAKMQEEAVKKAAEEAAANPHKEGEPYMPPDGLADHVKLDDAQKAALMNAPDKASDDAAKPPEEARASAPKLPVPHGPNETIVDKALPRGATLDDIPTPPPEAALPPVPAAKPAEAPRPSLFGPMSPPAGTVARPAAPPANAESAANTTQILSEEDLLVNATSGGKPPPPPHLPGLRPAGAPRPGAAPPLPPNPLASSDKKKA